MTFYTNIYFTQNWLFIVIIDTKQYLKKYIPHKIWNKTLYLKKKDTEQQKFGSSIGSKQYLKKNKHQTNFRKCANTPPQEVLEHESISLRSGAWLVTVGSRADYPWHFSESPLWVLKDLENIDKGELAKDPSRFYSHSYEQYGLGKDPWQAWSSPLHVVGD